MKRYHIPASITLAQGVLESAAGRSELALKGNNHFGIKCHGWTGRTVYHDDDENNEDEQNYDYYDPDDDYYDSDDDYYDSDDDYYDSDDDYYDSDDDYYDSDDDYYY